jgi:hypothetical protein
MVPSDLNNRGVKRIARKIVAGTDPGPLTTRAAAYCLMAAVRRMGYRNLVRYAIVSEFLGRAHGAYSASGRRHGPLLSVSHRHSVGKLPTRGYDPGEGGRARRPASGGERWAWRYLARGRFSDNGCRAYRGGRRGDSQHRGTIRCRSDLVNDIRTRNPFSKP